MENLGVLRQIKKLGSAQKALGEVIESATEVGKSKKGPSKLLIAAMRNRKAKRDSLA